MRVATVVLVVAVFCAAVSCDSRPPSGTSELPARVDSLASALFDTQLALSPEIGTSQGLPNAEHGRITDNSLAGIRSGEARFDTLYAAAVTIDPAALAGSPQEVTYAVLREALDGERALRVCRSELWGVASYVNGWQATYTDLALVQPVGTDTLRTLALARLHALPKYIDNEIVDLREGLRLGYSSPGVIVRNVISQMGWHSRRIRRAVAVLLAGTAGLITSVSRAGRTRDRQ